eukprot:TRINITY_DN750_c0_g1_i2.p3 TRINITY_DN750_c0_g1~~TRINITY_DN750_c0_g1_i2.p3  ORF type:complete len:58 (+),score=8.54 TRINITY_DN750_c0_g1_i2:168-341(+)
MNLSSVDNIVLKARRQRGGVKAEQLGYLWDVLKLRFRLCFKVFERERRHRDEIFKHH